MWIARDKDEGLYLFNRCPSRREKNGIWTSGPGYMPIDRDLFPNLKWEDDPVEVEIVPVGHKDIEEEIFEEIIESIKKYFE